MQSHFESHLERLRAHPCPDELVREVKTVFGINKDSTDDGGLRQWLASDQQKSMGDILMAVYVCNSGLTLLCEQPVQAEDDAAVHIKNKWETFDASSLTKVESKTDLEHDLQAFEEEINSLQISETDVFDTGDAGDF